MDEDMKRESAHSVISESDYRDHEETWDGFVQGCIGVCLASVFALLTLIMCAYGTASTWINMSIGGFGLLLGSVLITLSSIGSFSTWWAPVIFLIFFALCALFLIL